MVLCNVCQGFDIRALLLKSAAQKTRESGLTDRNLIDRGDYHPPISGFYKHLDSIVALKKSSEQGCSLCNLFWCTWLKTLNKPDYTEEWLDETFNGALYIGCSGWTTTREGLPYVIVSQHSLTGTRTLCSLEAFSDRNEFPADGQNILGKVVYDNSSVSECLSVGAEWLQICLSKHALCRETSMAGIGSPLPTRVIDVGREDCHPKLVLTNGNRDTWIALSYCWGGDSPFVLIKDTRADLERGVPLNNFPPTLRDAIIITRYLGIKYLWIDAICIQQDSPSDWAAEAAKMGEVYAGVLLTIAAADSASTNTGIFSKRKVKGNLGQLEWKVEDQGPITTHVYLRPGSELWDNTLQSSPLMSRGWTLQEGLLAPRTLSYGPQQMIWECSAYQADEGGRITIPTQGYRGKDLIQAMVRGESKHPPKPWKKLEQLLSSRYHRIDGISKTTNPLDVYERWHDILQQFTRRSLTKDTDTLPALAGLARIFQRTNNDVYCAGLWKSDIICGLLWDRLPRWSKDGVTRWDRARPSEYLAPSWSWASMLGGQTNFPGRRARETLSSKSTLTVAKVLSIHTVPKGPDPFGQLESGELVLKGRFYHLAEMALRTSDKEEDLNLGVQLTYHTPASKTNAEASPFLQYVHTAFRDTGRVEYEFLQQHVSAPSQIFALLELVRWAQAPGSGVPGMEFLALESTGNGHDEYRRIGLFGLRKERVPDPEAVGIDAYEGAIRENKAWEEVVRAEWKRRTVRIV